MAIQLDDVIIKEILSSDPAKNVVILSIPGDDPAVVLMTTTGDKLILTPLMARSLADQLAPASYLAQPAEFQEAVIA